MSLNAPSLIIFTSIRGVTFDVRVTPGASKCEVAGIYDGALKVRVSAPPERGKANKAVINLLAKLFDKSERDIEIKCGETSQNKTVEIVDITVEKIIERLKESGVEV